MNSAPLDLRDDPAATRDTASRVLEPQVMCRDACSGRPDDLDPDHRLITITGGDLWARAEAFVYEMYVKIGYTEPSQMHRVEELVKYTDRSRFHAVVDGRDTIIGTIRTIFGSYHELPVSQFERTDRLDPDPVCEFSSLVVDHTVRSTGVIEHLYRAAWLDAWRSGSQAVVALIDEWLLECFLDTYHLPFRAIGVGREYMGGAPVPVGMPLRGPAYEGLAEANSEFWLWTLEAVTPEELRDWHLPLVLLESPTAPQVDLPDLATPTAGVTTRVDQAR